MSKLLSLKVKEEVFSETEDILSDIHMPRNAYINEALSFYNKFMKRKALGRRLRKESRIVSAGSMEALKELELLEDEIIE